MDKFWYAFYTRPRWEKKVFELLTKKKIVAYCPLNKVIRQWADRKKTILEPLFPSYVFVQLDASEMIRAKETDGVINFVYWLTKPAVIKDAEIDAIKNFLNEYDNVYLEKNAVNVNDTVRIIRGPLRDYEGNVVSIKNNNKIVVSLPSLGYMMIAEVQRSNVTVLAKKNIAV